MKRLSKKKSKFTLKDLKRGLRELEPFYFAKSIEYKLWLDKIK